MMAQLYTIYMFALPPLGHAPGWSHRFYSENQNTAATGERTPAFPRTRLTELAYAHEGNNGVHVYIQPAR